MLTTAQKLTLKAYIAGQPDLSSQPDTNDGNEIAMTSVTPNGGDVNVTVSASGLFYTQQ